METVINLLDIGEINGVKRYQSALLLHRKDEADFIFKDGVMKSWGYNVTGGMGFYPYEGKYKICKNAEECSIQVLGNIRKTTTL